MLPKGVHRGKSAITIQADGQLSSIHAQTENSTSGPQALKLHDDKQTFLGHHADRFWLILHMEGGHESGGSLGQKREDYWDTILHVPGNTDS